jgi:hypothetical protein
MIPTGSELLDAARLLVLRTEIEFVYSPGKVFRNAQAAFDESPVDYQLCLLRR